MKTLFIILYLLVVVAQSSYAAPKKAQKLSKARKVSSTFEKQLQEWEQTKTAAGKGDQPSIKKVLEAGKGLVGLRSAEHTFAVIEIFKAQTNTVIAVARQMYSNNNNCLLRMLLPASGEIDASEIAGVLKGKPSEASHDSITDFRQAFDKYVQDLMANRQPNFAGCRFY